MFRKSTIFCLAALSAVFLAPAATSASLVSGPIGFDKSFGVDGIATVADVKYPRNSGGIAEAPGGKIVIGVDRPGSVLRFTARGRVDKAFGDDGFARFRAQGYNVNPGDVLVDRNGRTIGIGTAVKGSNPSYGGAIMRLERDGSVDRSFGRRGLFRPKATRSFEYQEAMFSRGGKIVAVARGYNRESDWVLVSRLLPNGRPDRSFSADGFRLLKFGSSHSNATVAVDKHGRIVVGHSGWPAAPGHGHFVVSVARLTSSGKLDRSFGEKGWAKPDVSKGSRESVADLAIDRRGRILVIGSTWGGPSALLRLTPSGRRDDSFAVNGVRKLRYMNEPGSVSIDSRGRINVVGFDYDGWSFESVVSRVLPNGSISAIDAKQGHCGGFCSDDIPGFADHFLDSRDRLVIAADYGANPTVFRLRNP